MIPSEIHADNIVSFEQTDQDEFTLTLFVDDEVVGDGHARITMSTFEAVHLHSLLVKEMGGYVAEMEAARASHARGEGPNGEPRGTWEDVVEDVYSIKVGAFRCNDPEGEWIREQADLANKARKENRPRPDYDPYIDHPERYKRGI